MTTFYKFPDDATYEANKQDTIPVVVLGRVPDGGEELIQINDQESTTVPTYHEGFHVNALIEVPEWEDWLLIESPETPWMIFG